MAKRAVKPRRKQKPPNVRAAILDAARALYFQHGPDGVSARKVAARVGVSATSIYIYYKNLDDLLHHLRMEGFTLLVEYLEQARGASALEHIVDMGRAYFRFGTEHPNYYELMFFYRFREQPNPGVIEREARALTVLRAAVASGIDRGELRADLDLAVVTNGLWAEIHGVTSLAVSGRLAQIAPGRQDAVLAGMFDGMARWLAPTA